jgi:hypothetical protein
LILQFIIFGFIYLFFFLYNPIIIIKKIYKTLYIIFINKNKEII